MHIGFGAIGYVKPPLRSDGLTIHYIIGWIFFMLLPMVFIQCETNQTHTDADIVSEGDRLPFFVAQVSISDTLDWRYGIGDSFDTERLLDKVGVIVFFHTSCDDCRRELPVVQSVYDDIKNDTSVSFVCISRAESESEICDYFGHSKLSLPYSAQSDRRIYELFATERIPRIYVADIKGIVRNVYSDSNAPDYTELMKAIDNSRTN